jgi:hypothetical protein
MAMEGLFQPMHLLVFVVGGLCFSLVVLGIVLLVLFLSRKKKDESLLIQLKEDNDRLREEIEKLQRRS